MCPKAQCNNTFCERKHSLNFDFKLAPDKAKDLHPVSDGLSPVR